MAKRQAPSILVIFQDPCYIRSTMNVELQMPNGPWVSIADFQCIEVQSGWYQLHLAYRGLIPVHLIASVGLRIDGVEAWDITPTDSYEKDGKEFVVYQLITGE